MRGVIGAIAGDIIGSIYEHRPIKTKSFALFAPACTFTDDTVLTVAVADAVMNGSDYARALRRYPARGYGSSFGDWARSGDPNPYGSFGNGSAMRVSPVAYAFDVLDAVIAEAARSAEVTHNHPEGVKGVHAVAAAVWLARQQANKADIRDYIERTFGYDLSGSVDAIRPGYTFDVSCQGSVPAALVSFLDACDYEDAVRNAISLGGDADTLACIAGAVAGAYYGVPEHITHETLDRLDEELRRGGRPV